jgi:hypothetical protein
MHIVIAVAVSLVVGFIVGKIQGNRVVADIQSVVAAAELRAETDVKKVIAAIRAKL